MQYVLGREIKDAIFKNPYDLIVNNSISKKELDDQLGINVHTVLIGGGDLINDYFMI